MYWPSAHCLCSGHAVRELLSKRYVGRVALYCTSSEHASSWRSFAGLPELRVWGGDGYYVGPDHLLRGGSGTARASSSSAMRCTAAGSSGRAAP